MTLWVMQSGPSEFDEFLSEFIPGMRDGDLLIITADHGCDPGYTKTTDHTREYVPFIAVGNEIKPVDLAQSRALAQ